MLRLVLMVYDGREERPLGEVRIVRNPDDYDPDIGSYQVRFGDVVVGTVEKFERKRGAWALTQLAMARAKLPVWQPSASGNTIGDRDPKYPQVPLKPYKRDGQCNGLTQRSKRCTTPAAPGSCFCLGHVWQQGCD